MILILCFARISRQHSQPDPGPSDHEQDVRVLFAGTKSKKSNRRNIVEQAQGRAATRELYFSFKFLFSGI